MYKIIKKVHLTNEDVKQINEIYYKQYNTKHNRHLYYSIKWMNEDPQDNFFILGILDNKIIAKCYILKTSNNSNERLIDSLIVDKDYQKQGYGTQLIDTAISILQEENVTKIVAFCLPTSRKLFSSLGFIPNENIKSFGNTIGEDDSLYYELNIKHNFTLEELTKDNALYCGLLLENEFKKYQTNIPGVLLPHKSMYQKYLLTLNTLVNEQCKVIKCGQKVIGYIYMWYEDYKDEWGEEHCIIMHPLLNEKYLYKDVFDLILEESIIFYNKHKNQHQIETIEMSISDRNILVSGYEFFKENLLSNGFENVGKDYYAKRIKNN